MNIELDDGNTVTLEELKADVERAKEKYSSTKMCFTYVTVEALLRKLDELNPEKKFTLFWMGGKREVVVGADISDAFTKAGYGSGAMAALNFHATGDNNEYKWDAKKKVWKGVHLD